MEYLLAVIGMLLVALGYQTVKKNTAQARNENIETKEKTLEIDKSILEKEAELKLEELKREELSKSKPSTNTVEDLLEFFNKKKDQ